MQNNNEVKLRNLGFPEEVIQESMRAERLGLFNTEPSADLVERTVARCRTLLRAPRHEAVVRHESAGRRYWNSVRVAPVLKHLRVGVAAVVLLLIAGQGLQNHNAIVQLKHNELETTSAFARFQDERGTTNELEAKITELQKSDEELKIALAQQTKEFDSKIAQLQRDRDSANQQLASAQSWSDIYNKARPSLLFVQTTKQKRDGSNRSVSTGTAFVVSESGYAVTSAHLVPEAASGEIVEYKVAQGSEGAPLAVAVVHRDTEHDLALLRLPQQQPSTSKWIALPVGASKATPEGSPLYNVGFRTRAGGAHGITELSGSTGVLSSTLAEARWQTTFPPEVGNSGSPIFDVTGKVVAIASSGMVAYKTGGDDAKVITHTYAVPTDYVRNMLSSFIPGAERK